MADDIAIDIRLQPPSKADINKTMSDLNKSLDSARRKTADPGISGWVDIAGMSHDERQAVFNQRRLEAAGRVMQKAAPSLEGKALTEEMKSLNKEMGKANSVWGKIALEWARPRTVAGLAGGLGLSAMGAAYGSQQLENAGLAYPMFGLRSEQAGRDLRAVQGRWALPALEAKIDMDEKAAQGMEYLRTREGRSAHPVRAWFADAFDSFGEAMSSLWSGRAYRDQMYGALAGEAAKAGIKTTGAGGMIGAGKQFGGDDLFDALQSAVLQSPVNFGPQ